MNAPKVMKARIPFSRGLFYELNRGHAVLNRDCPAGDYYLGTELQMNNILQMYELMRGDDRVGFWFYSGFSTKNQGGVLMAYQESKRGKATSSSVLLRHPEVIVFDVTGCGVIVVSPDVNQQLTEILQGQ